MSDPLDSFRGLVERIRPEELPRKHRKWIGNDENARNHNGAVERTENPLFMHLSWKTGKNATVRLVGCYRINMSRLVREGYALSEGSDQARLRFYRERNSAIYIGRGRKFPRIPVGTLARIGIKSSPRSDEERETTPAAHLKKVQYAKLNPKQKEIYNFQKVAGILAV